MPRTERPQDPRLPEETQLALAGLSGEVNAVLKRRRLNRNDLADIVGVNKSSISQTLGHGGNPTLQTVVEIFLALGHRVRIVAEPLEENTPPDHLIDK